MTRKSKITTYRKNKDPIPCENLENLQPIVNAIQRDSEQEVDEEEVEIVDL